MSRVGKLAVAIPSDVQVDLTGDKIAIKGKKGELEAQLHNAVNVSYENDAVLVQPANSTKESRSLWGTFRSLIANMVEGVTNGYEIRIEIKGVGYRAASDNKMITLTLGYSHEIKYAIPSDINITCEKPTLIVISGASKQKVGQIAGELMKLRPVEPYKGKGVFKEGAYIRRKEGKKK